MEGLKNTVVVGYGDFQQILPIIGSMVPKRSIINAAMCSADNWQHFKVFKFTDNLRLTVNDNDAEDTRLQRLFAELLAAIGSGSALPSEPLAAVNHFGYSVPPPAGSDVDPHGRRIHPEFLRDTNHYQLRNFAHRC